MEFYNDLLWKSLPTTVEMIRSPVTTYVTEKHTENL